MASGNLRKFAGLAAAGILAITAAQPAAGTAEAPLALRMDSGEVQWGPCPPLFPEGCEIAVLHGDPAAPNADIFFRVPAGYTIPPHSHTSAERMVLVSGRLQVTYKDNPAITLTPGMYAYGPPEAPHRAACEGSEPCVLFIAFEGPVDAHPFEGAL